MATAAAKSAPAAGKCAAEGCGKPANMRCPTCIKLGLPPIYFCGKECFTKAWPTHKLLHALLTSSGPSTNISFSSPSSSDVDERFAGYPFTGRLRPGVVSPMRSVPSHIPRPDYAETGEPESENQFKRGSMAIEVHTPEQIAVLREASVLSREALDLAGSMIRPGITTDEIDKAVHEFIISKGGYPSPLNYRGFPKSICTSINEAVCHGIPDSRPLEEGDICNVDVSVYYKGYHGDVNDTFFVGQVSPEAQKLVQVTYEALEEAIKIVKPGRLYRDLGQAISKHVSKHGFSVVRTYCGHGVGALFHTSPNVPHYAKNKAVGVMKPGHVFTIEPMINMGDFKDTTWPDDWTSVTRDGKLSAQFEHTMVVTETGVEVLTARTSKSYPYPWLK
jgi:methionyl aminopeptidase